RNMNLYCDPPPRSRPEATSYLSKRSRRTGCGYKHTSGKESSQLLFFVKKKKRYIYTRSKIYPQGSGNLRQAGHGRQLEAESSKPSCGNHLST
uniref:Uncharacterized protein n=1 Tax=Fundulus heteroclitus TaxID=8078 RepID=A0A3Q2TM45_FUNHE